MKGDAMRFVIIVRGFFVAALAAGSLALGAAPAQAYPVCAGVSATGVAGSHGVEKCVPYSGATLCHWERVTVGSLAIVIVSACHPW